MPRKVKSKRQRQRVNMRLPTDLFMWAKDFASTENTSVTQVVVDLLTDLKEKIDDKTASAG